ncbi:putative MFS family arabinose efflux permease [Pelomonas saccharophila]|uniref:MFS family arabinose efflux permease n=1 Tax=Roseateles saccharophilus TaxID=304 RepID=A0ABU1YUY5_ROSSA|nr:MFS transporter [Roseateles saccharophilus]MDR7272673.1 putative MFS family arabinose efflux permease [Roseateles saccharophilus]
MTPSATRQLWLLALANFAIGMGAFVVVGVLSPVALAFGVDRAHAGALMSVYAGTYAIASPLLIAATGRLDRRRLMSIGLALFAAGSVMAALAPSFALLLAARALMALGGGLVTPVAASVGVALAGPGQQGRALAIVFGGLTFAQVLGIPAGAWLGYALGWQAAFVVVAMLTLVGLAAIVTALPAGIAVPVASLSKLGKVLRDARLMVAVAFTALFTGGLYVCYTFVAPLLESLYGLSRDGVTGMLLLFGLGAVVGNAMGGRLTDRIGSRRTLVLLCLAQSLLMPALTLPTWPLAAVGALMFIWSVFGWSFMVPQQARLAALDPAQLPVLFALNASAIYVGATLGSAVGGAVLKGLGLHALGLFGAALALLGLASLAFRR